MPDRNFTHVTLSDYARVLVSQPSTSWDIMVAGGGDVNGNTTYGVFDLTVSGSTQLTYTSSTYATCSGDPGGPAFFMDSSNYRYVSAQHSGGGNCTPGTNSVGARWTESRVGWLDEVLDDIIGGGCASYSNPFGTHYKCY